MNGVLIINKPRGWTSHDVVAKIRRLLNVSKVGHTGTLDPLATGVLVVCVGKATRIARYLESDEKEYEAEIRLGTITDTLDIEGRVLETRTYEPPAEQKVRSALKAFTGSISQRPPAFSAIKIQGVPAHRLARAGDARELPARQVTISTLKLLEFEDPRIRLHVRCSKGTYIRSLGADIGNSLGTGACLTALTRTRAGQFSLDQAVTLDQAADLLAKSDGSSLLIPLANVLKDFARLTLTDEENRLVSHGNAVAASPDHALIGEEDRLCLMDGSGMLVAVGRKESSFIKPEVVLV